MDDTYLQLVITIVCSVLASSGVWTVILKTLDKKDAKTKLLIAIAHDLIVQACVSAIEKKEITEDEYENIRQLYEPYRACGGNHIAEKFFNRLEHEVIIIPNHDLSV